MEGVENLAPSAGMFLILGEQSLICCRIVRSAVFDGNS